MSTIDSAIDVLIAHERKFDRTFSLIPSENLLSPMARLAFLSDGFSRYFFNEREVFGRWSFEGGSIVGRLQTEFLMPTLREVGRAKHVNLHPISGLSGMTLALMAFGGEPGDRVLSVPVANGGHPDTAYVARKLGLEWHELPFSDWATLDVDTLAARVSELGPSVVYIDHATHLFPLDLRAVISAIRRGSRAKVHVHVDTSHVNGLVWGGVLDNPLECGADSYGGSTHKTFPGPHKAVLLLDDDDLAEKLILTAVNSISHHHTASVAALALSMIEFVECGGHDYAAQIVCNGQAFAAALAERGFAAQGKDGELTRNHQVWIAAPAGPTPYESASTLFAAGLVINPYNPVPSLGGPGLRMGVNEATKLGLREADMVELAQFISRLLLGGEPAEAVAPDIAEFRRGFSPSYCFGPDEVAAQRARFIDR